MVGKKRATPRTTVQFDHDNDATYTTLGCIERTKIPSQSKEAINANCLDSQVEEAIPSEIPEMGEFDFVLFSDPDDADQGLLQTAFRFWRYRSLAFAAPV